MVHVAYSHKKIYFCTALSNAVFHANIYRIMSKELLLRLLAQNELDELFRQLRESAQSELVLLESQWHDLKSDSRAGVLTQEQANVEEARIRRRLLDYIESGGKTPLGQTAPAPQLHRPQRQVLLGFGLLAGLVAAFFLLKPLFTSPPGAATADADAPETEQPAAPFSKKLAVPTEPIELTADYVRTTGYQFLEAVLTNKNPENYRLMVRMRCIRPPYGENVSSHTLHLLHDETEIAPYEVEFPFVQAKTIGEGTLSFEVPKAWKDARLVLYYGTGYEVKSELPLKF